MSEVRVPLFYPFVPEEAKQNAVETLSGKWIGQGPKVDIFEKAFEEQCAPGLSCVAVSAATHALHLAFLLSGISVGDEVIAPVFSCAATSIPLLYQGAKVRFADIDPATMNISVSHVKNLLSERTKAIVCVHYAGLPCDLLELQDLAREVGATLICDAAQALGATYEDRSVGCFGDFTIFSFQAIKHITTGDGGMLVLKNQDRDLADRLRWFGIDRKAKYQGRWDNQIRECGYKYQMNDLAASLGIAGLEHFPRALEWRQKLFRLYLEGLSGVTGVDIVGVPDARRTHAAWAFTILADERSHLEQMLAAKGIETGQVHYRNDRYQIFGGERQNLKGMDDVENRYLLLPLHHRVTVENVEEIVGVIRGGSSSYA